MLNFSKSEITVIPTTVIQDVYFVNVQKTWSVSLANGNIRVWFRDDGGSPILGEGISVCASCHCYCFYIASFKRCKILWDFLNNYGLHFNAFRLSTNSLAISMHTVQ